MDELKASVEKQKPFKAPGLDGITVEYIKELYGYSR